MDSDTGNCKGFFELFSGLTVPACGGKLRTPGQLSNSPRSQGPPLPKARSVGH
jgi:hypothetical protein